VDCPHIPELGYGQFSQRLHDKVAGRRIPLVGSLELTFRCNLRCVHCYVAHGHQGIPGRKELTAGEIRAILEAVVDEGCFWLLLTGGEPLLRPDFLDIYTDAKRKGLIVTLFTNGTLLSPQIADSLAEWRPFVVEVTLYGRTQETYERMMELIGTRADSRPQ
jgi:MoaA/NifB/PqqE/SkfB family radical SAM enzyme